ARHRTADGRELLVVHGDHFDGIVTYARWLALLGDRAYAAALWSNNLVNAVRRRFGFSFWSLAAFLKHRVKNAAMFISDFEQAVGGEGHDGGADGVVCGHIHHPEMKVIGDVLYCNDGDWVESCSALVEDARGRLEMVYWTSFASQQSSARKPRPVEQRER